MTSPATNSADWQLKLGSPGAIAEGAADVEQCLQSIVLTPRGSVPSDPQFGCDIALYLDRPLSVVRALITSDLLDAFAYGEPRARIISVQVTADGVDDAGASGALLLLVEWTIAETNDPQTTSIAIGGSA